MLASYIVQEGCTLCLLSTKCPGVSVDHLQKNCAGSLSVVPYTTSADEHLMLSFTAVRSPRSTKGKFSSQFDRFNIALKADFRLRWNLSAKPLDSG